MNRMLQIGSVLLLVGIGASYGKGRQAKNAPPPKSAPVKPPGNRGGVARKEPIPKGAARLLNPASVAARLFRMSPEERDRVIERLPERARDNARRQLAWFDRLPKEQQDMQLRRLDRFAQLTPEKRAEVMGMMVEVNHLPPPRAGAVRQALYRLQQMNDAQREKVLARPEFQARFSPEELRVIKGLADAWMGPVE